MLGRTELVSLRNHVLHLYILEEQRRLAEFWKKYHPLTEADMA